jgi:hypothetical protein
VAKSKIININIEQHQFNRKAARLSKEQGKPLKEVLKQGVIFFTQSAVKNAKPKGRSRVSLSLRGEEEQVKKPAIRSRGIIKQQDHGDRKFRIPFRNKDKKGSIYAKTKSEARKKSKIDFRFVGKKGWHVAGEDAIKGKIPVKLKVSSAVDKISNRLGDGKFKRVFLKPLFILINKVKRIGNYDRSAAAISLRSARLRMGRLARKTKKEYGKLWR